MDLRETHPTQDGSEGLDSPSIYHQGAAEEAMVEEVVAEEVVAEEVVAEEVIQEIKMTKDLDQS